MQMPKFAVALFFAVFYAGNVIAVDLKIDATDIPALASSTTGITDVRQCGFGGSGTPASLNPTGLGTGRIVADVTGRNCVEVVTVSGLSTYTYNGYDISNQCNIFSEGVDNPSDNGFTLWGGPDINSQVNFSQDCEIKFNPPPPTAPPPPGGPSPSGGSATPVPALPLFGLLALGGLLGLFGLRKLKK